MNENLESVIEKSNIVNPAGEEVLKLAKKPLMFRLFMLQRLPLAAVVGLRIDDISPRHCVTSAPYKYLNKNPFKSMYFAVMTMAAELSTGILGMYQTHKRKPSVAMLLVNVEGSFFKKCTERIYFHCNDGEAIAEVIAKTLETGEGVTVTVPTVAKDKEGNEIATFKFTWSFKKRKK